MGLSPCYVLKESAPTIAGTPLVVAEFTFLDGSTFFVSTQPLNSSEGGYASGFTNYFSRIMNMDISGLTARSSDGIDRFPNVSVQLADPDKLVYDNYETWPARGFRGAQLVLRVFFWEADTTSFSSDSQVIFLGVAGPPTYGKGLSTMTVQATASRNMAHAFLPVFINGARCEDIFPSNAAQRLDGATNMSSPSWGCGYDPDQSGTDPEIGGDCRRGNTGTANQTGPNGLPLTDSGGRYLQCNYTKSDCVLRGMYTVDSQNRATGRFTANQWGPAQRVYNSESYISGKTIPILQLINSAAYNQRFPMVYGQQWVQNPVTTVVLADANSTRFETSICQDDIGLTSTAIGTIGTLGYVPGSGPQQVVVNGVIVPHNGSGSDALFRWNFNLEPGLGPRTSIGGGAGTPATTQSTGSRNGVVCADAGFDSQGDPHGSVATIEVVVYNQLATPGQLPSIQILTFGPKIKTPTTTNWLDQGTWPKAWTANPAYCVLDALIWSNWQYSQFDLSTIITEQAWCSTQIGYSDLNGNSVMHAAYICSFSLEQRRSAGETIQAILRGFNAQLVRNPSTGLIGLMVRKGLADQQPSAVAGSNYDTAVLSTTAFSKPGALMTASGYVAYRIDETVILQDNSGNFQIEMLMDGNPPNTLSFGFQDEDNSYSVDSITDIDADAVYRAGGYSVNTANGAVGAGDQIQENLTVLGVSNFDQATRICNTYLAEQQRGNENQDTRGTRRFRITMSIKALSLRVGQIVLLQYQQLALQPFIQLQSPPGTPISGILCRIEEIAPQLNFETAQVTIRWHEDIWYTWAYAQAPAPLNSQPGATRDNRPPYPWQPYGTQPITGDSVYGTPLQGYEPGSWWFFTVAQFYVNNADGTAQAQCQIGGCPSVNIVSTSTQPPVLATQGSSSATGGTIPGGMIFHFAIAGMDAGGLQTALSSFFTVAVPVGTNTNAITTPTIYWQPGTVGYMIYGGPDGLNLSVQGFNASGTPGTITLDNINFEEWGPPDLLASKLNFRAKRVIHGGVWGDECTGATSNTITFNPPTPWTTNQWFLYDIQLVAFPQGSTVAVPVANFSVVSNTGNTITVSTSNVLSVGITAGCVFIMLARPSSATTTTVGCAYFVNAYAPSGLTVDEGLFTLRVIAGTGIGQVRSVASNTATVYTVSKPFDIVLDSTSRFIIEDTTWTDDLDSAAINNPGATNFQEWNFNVTNYEKQTILVEMNTKDANGNLSLEAPASRRMMYVWGGTGTVASYSPGYNVLSIVSNAVTPDLGLGINVQLNLNQTAAVTVNNPISSGVAIAPGSTTGFFTLYVIPTVTGVNNLLWGSAFGSDVTSKSIGADVNSISTFYLQLHQLPGDSAPMWHCDNFVSGS